MLIFLIKPKSVSKYKLATVSQEARIAATRMGLSVMGRCRSMWKLSALLLLLAIATSNDCLGQEKTSDPASLPAPKRVIIPKLRGGIKIDGELKEAVWKKAVVLEPFYKNDGSGREREHTEVRLWYDKKALYLGWLCQDSDILATFTNRDSTFWDEEVVEFFVTSKALNRYFELEWNPLGGVFDAIIENKMDEKGVSKSFRGDWSYTAKTMKSAAKVKGTVNNSNDKDESWQVEVMLPFVDLGLDTPKPGDIWRGNFYRFNRGKGEPVEALSWSPTLLPGFHQPSRFGYLEFGK